MILTISNILTVLRVVLTFFFLFFFFSNNPWLQCTATIAFIAGAITDHWDGKLARRRKEITEFGKFADPLADKFLTLSAFIAIWIREDFGVYHYFILFYIILIFLRDFGITFLRLWAVAKETPVITSIYGKLKTTFQLIALIFSMVYFNFRDIIPLFSVDFNFLNPRVFIPIIHVLFLICAFLTVMSGILYLRPASLESKPPST